MIITPSFRLGFHSGASRSTSSAIKANSARVFESKYNEIEREITKTQAEIEREQDPAILKMLNETWHLGLVQPSPQQIAYIDEDPVVRLAAKHNRDLFADRPAPAINYQPAALRR